MREPLIPAPALVPAAALAWWVIGYLAWLVDGLGSSIKGVQISSIATDSVTIPLLLTELPHLVLGGFVGGICAGLLTIVGHGRPVTNLAASFAGVACAVLLTGIQSTSTLRDVAARGYDDGDSFGQALTAITAVAALLGWLLGVGGSFDRAPLGVALAGLAGASSFWLGMVTFAIDPSWNADFLTPLIRYASAALLTVGLVTIGIDSYKRLLAWPVAVALAWLVVPAYSVVGLLASYARWPGELPDVLRRHWDIVELSVPPENYSVDTWLPFVIAILLAIAISIRLGARRAAELDAHSPVDPSNSSRTTSM